MRVIVVPDAIFVTGVAGLIRAMTHCGFAPVRRTLKIGSINSVTVPGLVVMLCSPFISTHFGHTR